MFSMVAYIIQFYRFMTILFLGICTSVVMLFLTYTHFLQNDSAFSQGLKHGLSIATLLVIWETYIFIRRQSIFVNNTELTSHTIASEIEKGSTNLKKLRVKIIITFVITLLISIMHLLNIYAENLFLQGLKSAVLLSTILFLMISLFLFFIYRSFLSKIA